MQPYRRDKYGQYIVGNCNYDCKCMHCETIADEDSSKKEAKKSDDSKMEQSGREIRRKEQKK